MFDTEPIVFRGTVIASIVCCNFGGRGIDPQFIYFLKKPNVLIPN